MAEYIVLIFIAFTSFWIPYKHYEPKIEAVALVKRFRVCLWYNKWDGPRYKGRVYKYLFEI